MRRFVLFLIFLTCVTGALPVRAFSAPVVYGRISDAVTQEGLLGVNIQLAEAVRGTSSDDKGDYRLELPRAGTWTLRVTHIGYAARTQVFSIGDTDSVRVDVALGSSFLQGDEVLVTAQARESTARLSTTKVEVVDAAQVEQRSAGTLDRVLDAVPGLEAHRTGGQVVSNLSIRGSSDMLGGGVGNRTLLLVDGKPANISDTDGAAWWLYPDDVIERVEVVKGAYSALYGSNAMGGVVNLITRSPSYREFTRIHASYGAYQRPPDWMSYSDRMHSLSTLSFSHSHSIGRFGYFANATRRASDGWRQSSAYDNISLFGKFTYDLSPTRSLTLSTLYLTGENEYPHPWKTSAGYQPLYVEDKYTNDLQRKRSGSLDVTYRRVESANSAYTVRAFYNQDLTRSILNPPTDPRTDDVPVGFQTRSISQKFGLLEQTTHRWTTHNTLVFGVDAVWDEIDGQPDTYLYGRQGSFSPAVYAQNDYNPVPALHLTAGARYDYRRVHDVSTTNQISPKAGVSYEVRRNIVLRASVGHAFRNPSMAEMFLKKIGSQEYELEPNPKLKPETVDFGEAGFNWRMGDYAAVDGAAFSYRYSDVIRWQLTSNARYQTHNLSTARIRGFELGIRSQWPAGIKQTASATYLHTDIDHKGPLTYVPEWRFYYSAAYDYKAFQISGDVRYVSRTDTVIFHPTDAPRAYTLISLRAALLMHQNTRLAFLVDNVTNVQYEEMERYRMPPRTFRAELIYELDVAH